MYVLFYEGDTQRGLHSTVKGDLMLYPQGNTNPLGVATADALNGQARVFVKKDANPYQGKNLKLVVIANFHGALTDLQEKHSHSLVPWYLLAQTCWERKTIQQKSKPTS